MSLLNVPGAQLNYEVYGQGSLLVFIPGSNGGGDIFGKVAASLAAHFRVVTYDRRGYFRSKLEGSLDYAQRLKTDASDVRLLIEHLSDKPAILFGTDSGAIIALEALKLFPEKLELAVVHEPLLVKLLPDAARWEAFFDEVYETYRKAGVPRAMHLYASTIGSADHRLLMPFIREQTGERGWANAAYWIEHELRQYCQIKLGFDALATNTRKLLLAGGVASRDELTYQPNKIIAQKLDLPIVDLPGGHLGYLSDPAEFAKELIGIL